MMNDFLKLETQLQVTMEKEDSKKIRIYLTLFPYLIQEIENDWGVSLKQITCLYNLEKHRRKIAKRYEVA